MEKLKKLQILDSVSLKLLATAFMLCDHMWALLIPGSRWLSDIGRLAFPIFAFQIAEGYFKTSDYKKYLGRLCLLALLSELPFDLMYSGSLFFPFHQNVIFTFCIALPLMRLCGRAAEKGRGAFALCFGLCCLLGFLAGSIFMTDYFGFGVLTVLLFYLCREKSWGLPAALAGLIIINGFMLKGQELPFYFLGRELFFPQQAFAVFAIIPIALYNGRSGRGGRGLRRCLYLFYPLHMLLLALGVKLLSR